jgi:GT2 family glycosyltransferase
MVIDNCPTTAETRELVSSCPTIRYALCDEPGLDRARNLALRLAGGSIVAFIDDDVRVHPGWLERIVRNFNDPIVGVATGITLPAELETEAQITLERIASFIKGFERREFTAFNADPFHVAGMGAGSSMAIRTSILGEVGVFNEQLDGGTPTLSGGDHEFFSRTLRRGYRIVYDNSAIAWHLHRRTENEALKTVFGYGVGVFAWWTCTLVREREYSLLLAAPLTLIQYHARRLVCSFTGSADAPPAHYAWAELRGALTGPFAYFRSLLTEGRRQ